MRMVEACAACLYRKQQERTDDAEYLAEVGQIIRDRGPLDSAPLVAWRCDQVYERRFGPKASYREIKQKYNAMVLSMEEGLRKVIRESEEPLRQALMLSRAGNYIDFAALQDVREERFLSLLQEVSISERDERAVRSFIRQCQEAERFLLIADNCGEIVLDKLLIEEIRREMPDIRAAVMVRGGEAGNDATVEDAAQIGLAQVAEVVTNGYAFAGTEIDLLPARSRELFDRADVILAKGQANYETLGDCARPLFFSLLCKCDLFTERFQVPKLTGVFVEHR